MSPAKRDSEFDVRSSAPKGAVFLSYASQDAEAAKRIAEALRAAGVEVWFDQSELRGGDAWDQKIREQIQSCALFVPVISENTQSRPEGYFRLEWKIAVDRSHLMSDDHPFLVPVVIDETPDAAARVPARFRERQWTRLSPDQIPPAFIDRVKRLLVREVARASHGSETLGRLDSKPAASRRGRPRSIMFTIAGAIAVVAAIILWSPWRHDRAAAPTAATLSPARELVAKARHLFEVEDPSLRENLSLAEDLLLRAEELDEFDGEVWAAHAQLSGVMMDWGIDRSDERRAAMRKQSDRAMQLAPDSTESQLAKAWFLLAQRSGAADAIPILERLIERMPDDGRPQMLMGSALRRTDRAEDAIRWFEKSAAQPRTSASAKSSLSRLLYTMGRLDEADRVLDESIAIRPLGMALAAKLRAQVLYRGDLDGAVETLKRIPSSLLLDERGAYNAYRVWLWRREPDKALRVLRDLPLDFIDDVNFLGPKAVLVAAAEELAGRPDLANGSWEFALHQVEERLKSAPNDEALLYHRALCLTKLGRTAEAGQALLRLQQAGGFWGFCRWPGGGVPGILIKLGRTAEALDELESQEDPEKNPGAIDWLMCARPVLGLNPDFDAARDDPRFKAILQRLGAGASSADPAATSTEKSVAVLAFANLSDDKGNEYFSDGISEELLNVLAKVPGLKVTARTSAFFFKGKQVPIAEIARQLGVAYVIEGSVRKQGDRVRISAQLIKASDGFQVWSNTFDRNLEDIFAVQDEIAVRISSELTSKLGVASTIVSGTSGTRNVAAYEAFLKGRQAWTTHTYTSVQDAVRHFQEALALDPGYALAYGALAEAYLSLSTDGAEPADKVCPLAKAAAERALALDPNVVQAHTALAEYYFHYAWDYPESDRHIERALAVDPNYSVAHARLSGHLGARNRLEEALEASRRALELDPLGRDNSAAWILFSMGRLDEALAAAREEVTWNVFPRSERENLGLILFVAGQQQEGIALLESVVRDYPDEIEPLNILGWVYGRAGESDRARRIFQRLEAMGEARFVSPLVLAQVAAGFDDRDLVFAQLERAYARREPLLPFSGWNPFLAPVRDDARFRDMLKRLKLDVYFPEPKES